MIRNILKYRKKIRTKYIIKPWINLGLVFGHPFPSNELKLPTKQIQTPKCTFVNECLKWENSFYECHDSILKQKPLGSPCGLWLQLSSPTYGMPKVLPVLILSFHN